MKKSLILALSAAFIFNAAGVSEAALNNYPHRVHQDRYDSSEDYSSDKYSSNKYPSQRSRQPSIPQYNPQPAPPFLTDKQKKNWRKQESEREQWFDEARSRIGRENQQSSRNK